MEMMKSREAWQLEGEDGQLVVSVAGGGLSAWDAS
jgi:hypothetical protein